MEVDAALYVAGASAYYQDKNTRARLGVGVPKYTIVLNDKHSYVKVAHTRRNPTTCKENGMRVDNYRPEKYVNDYDKKDITKHAKEGESICGTETIYVHESKYEAKYDHNLCVDNNGGQRGHG